MYEACLMCLAGGTHVPGGKQRQGWRGVVQPFPAAGAGIGQPVMSQGGTVPEASRYTAQPWTLGS